MKRRFSPKQYAERLRRQRRRLYLQDGVLSVRFIKFFGEQPPGGAALPEPEPGCYYTDSGENPAQWTPGEAEDWARSLHQGEITPPWPGGAA